MAMRILCRDMAFTGLLKNEKSVVAKCTRKPGIGRWQLEEYLRGGTQTGAQGSVNRAPVSRGVGVFACEIERVLDGHGQFFGSAKRPFGRVAVCAEAEWVGLPVMRMKAEEERIEVGALEDCGQRGKRLVFQGRASRS